MINNIMDRDMKCYKRNVYVANRTKSILNRKSWKFTEFFKFIGPSGADFQQVRQKPHTWRSYCPPNILFCFVCNGFAKHVPWLLISCLTDCLCNLGSKYNGRICPGFINSKFGKQSYPQSFCNIIVDWWD